MVKCLVGVELRDLEVRVGDEAGKLDRVWSCKALSVRLTGWGLPRATDSPFCLYAIKMLSK